MSDAILLKKDLYKPDGRGGAVTDFDYLNYIFNVSAVAEDLTSALGALFFPKIVDIEGYALVKSIGADEIFLERKRAGMGMADAQYWANMLNVSELFNSQYSQSGFHFSELIRGAWGSQVERLAPSSIGKPRLIEDDGEFWITICAREADSF